MLDEYFDMGEKIYENTRKITKHALDKYISPDGSIDGSKMQEDWFPQNIINADVFISHSHKDKNNAIALAGWLYEKFKLQSFIDSCIWSFSDNLLKEIDNKYCWTDDKHETYNYAKRNYSTSHVHLMLSTALNKMMDKTECLFFMNTINSITPKGLIEQTESPWIYSEITMSQLIKKNLTGREELVKSELIKSMSERALLEAKMPSIKYTLGLSHLKEIDEISLLYWVTAYLFDNENRYHPLDIFYNQNPK